MAETSKQAVWVARMALWSRSGLSRGAWCARHGVNVHTFDYWRCRLKEKPAQRKRVAGTGLVPIRVTAATAAERLEVILPSGVRLHVPGGVDVAQVAELMRALGVC